MKKIFFATGVLAALALTTSCDKYDIYPEQFDGVFTIRDAGKREVPVYTTDELVDVPFVVMKGGYDADLAASVTLKSMNSTEFADYVERTGYTYYAAIPENCYTFTPEGEATYSVEYSFAGGKEDHYRAAKLYIRPQVLNAWLIENAEALEGKTPIIPVVLESDKEMIDENGGMVIVVPQMHSPSMTIDVDPVVARTILAGNLDENGGNTYAPETNFSIPCSNPWGFTLNVEASEDALAAYNKANKTSFNPMPAEAFTLATKYHFAPGTTSMPLDLVVDLDKLQAMKNYAVAVTFADPAVTWDKADYNPGDALNIPATTIIYTVKISDAVELQKIQLSEANVTSVDMELTEGSIAALFDDNENTYYHSAWSRSVTRQAPWGSYLQIELPQPMSRFRFVMANRNSATVAGYAKRVLLFGSNDPDVWPTTPFAEIDNMTEQLNGAAAEGSFGTDDEPFTDGMDYKYIRFSVVETGSGADLNQPSSGSVYWCCSKFELYGY